MSILLAAHTEISVQIGNLSRSYAKNKRVCFFWTHRTSIYSHEKFALQKDQSLPIIKLTSGYATWFTAGGAIRIAHYDVIDDVITRKL